MTLIRSSAHIYRTIPPFQKPENTKLLLLIWSTMVSGRPLDVLREWARSENGWDLCSQLARDIQYPQSVEQLTLTMAALISYRRLLPDFTDRSDQAIKNSYLADLDAFLSDQSLGNSGIVGECMISSLIRVLSSSKHDFDDLIKFLGTVLDREPSLLHVFNGFSDQYLGLRIDGLSHENAVESHLKMLELRRDDDPDWVIVTPSKALSPAVETEYVPAVMRPPACLY
jgi:hypothetical protein